MIPAIVLAAGKSSRMGRPKALLPIGPDHDTFLTRIIAELRAGGVDRIIVVIGGNAPAVRASLPPDPWITVVENANYEQGQLSSLLVGLDAATREQVDAVMVTLVDLPLITAATVRAVLAGHQQSPHAALVRPRRGLRHGHPAIFHRMLFDELRNADPSRGAKPVVLAHQAEEVHVDVTDDGPFTDVDTPDDYDRWIRPTLGRGRQP